MNNKTITSRLPISGFILCLVLAVFLNSCKTSKVVNGSTMANPSLVLKDIIKTHEVASPNFKTLAARVQVNYKDEKKSQSITVSLRMEKDKTIWIKASVLGITLAKINITTDKVSYYEKLSGSYFDGDYQLLSEWLGTELDFNKVQNILLGQSIFQLDKSRYSSTVFQNKYKIEPKQQPENFIHSILLNPNNFKVALESLSQPSDNRLLSVNYGEYQKIEGDDYPSEVLILTSENDKKTSIELKFKKIDHNA
ncbi:MAG: DUF4292 domain-containing protein [Flavobacteriaceae bacterium]|nr:DUF4292 domain-containing protein [Flavobacteriaceae bacterium]